MCAVHAVPSHHLKSKASDGSGYQPASGKDILVGSLRDLSMGVSALVILCLFAYSSAEIIAIIIKIWEALISGTARSVKSNFKYMVAAERCARRRTKSG